MNYLSLHVLNLAKASELPLLKYRTNATNYYEPASVKLAVPLLSYFLNFRLWKSLEKENRDNDLSYAQRFYLRELGLFFCAWKSKLSNDLHTRKFWKTK